MANDFKGASRDTRTIKTPKDMWQFARNILLSKGFLSVTNENGFNKQHDIPGTYVGKIETNNHIVYMSIDGDYSCIGYVSTENNESIYVPVLRTNNPKFKFNIHCPIEGVYTYNYKNELIVVFSDGIKPESSYPKLVNISNIQIELDNNFELVNPDQIGLLGLFPQTNEAVIDIEYNSEGLLDADVVYITHNYVFDDNTDTAFYPIHKIAYLSTGIETLDRRSMTLTFSNLDENFNKLRIGLLVKKGGGLFAYQSNILGYNNGELTTTVNSFTNYGTLAPEELILTKQTFDKIRTITRQNNGLLVGNTIKEEFTTFQKYANLLDLGLYKVDETNTNKDLHNYPTFMPDEVYSYYISLHMTDGTYTRDFHIPGMSLTGVDNAVLDTNLTRLNYGLGLENQNYRSFHLFNTGRKDVVAGNNKYLFGKWENDETYPNTEDYNSTVDYDGNFLGGEDLRGKKIRYHRIPGLDTLAKDYLNEMPNIKNPENEGIRFGLKIENFNDVVPLEIREKIQGYRLSFVKRNRGDSLVESNTVVLKAGIYSQEVAGVDYDTSTVIHGQDKIGENSSNFIINQLLKEEYNKGKIFANELFKFQPRIDPTIVKANYIFHVPKANLDAIEDNFLPKDLEKFAHVDKVEYLPEDNIAARTRFTETTIETTFRNLKYPNTNATDFNWKPTLLEATLQGSPVIYSNLKASVREASSNTANGTIDREVFGSIAGELALNATLLNLQTVVYAGFKSNNLVTIGRVPVYNNLAEDVILNEGGDVFLNNKLNLTVQQNYQFNSRFKLEFKGLYSPLNNVQAFTREPPIDAGDADGLLGQSAEDLNVLNSLDYSVEVEGEEDLSSLNDITTLITYDTNDIFVNQFPYRINKGLKIPNESLQTRGLRTFLSDDYYELRNDRGPIVALRGTIRSLYIQTKYTLFLASIKDQLDTDGTTTFLGESDLFDRLPQEIMYNENKGYIGSTSQYACFIFKGGYATIDQVQGKIFIIAGSQAMEISSRNMRNYFKDNWNIPENYKRLDINEELQKVDNPYVSVGHLVGYDDDYNRLLFTKRSYQLREEFVGLYNFDGEFYYDINADKATQSNSLDFNDEKFFINKSITWSYSLDSNVWVCEHDYFPNSYQYTNKGLYSVLNSLGSNAQVFKHNDNETTGYYYGKHFDSYIDIIFNNRLDLSKQYKAFKWVTEVLNKNGSIAYFETIDGVVVYNDHQCSGFIDIKNGLFEKDRVVENTWNFNEFRDIVVRRDLPLKDDRGTINTDALNINRVWFEKSNFISNFIVIRMIIDNKNNKQKFIHNVNVISETSNR